ncbi:GntR family transcriptional regulator [Parahaliea maris]|uniref:GntR family transcriptional regulator n=1 Tax=Parahaliea maris TaxID=2716870 RepID=UPI00164F8723|nr:GntR family transcriptional regulator [Parahaliea maris]
MPDKSSAGEIKLSKTETAYRLLEEKIVTMELAPGALLSEAELSLELGLGRTPVREALQRLSAEHLVEIMPRRGIRVAGIDVVKQLRVLEVRRVLEVQSASLAARRASPAQRASFAAIAEGLAAAGSTRDYRDFLRFDRELDELLPAAAGNEFASAMLRQLHGLSRRFWHYYFRREADLPHVAGLHAAIARSIAEGDEEEAARATEAHMEYIHNFTRAVLEG